MSYSYIKRKQIFFNGFPTTKNNFQITFSISTKQDDKLLSHKLFPNKHLPQQSKTNKAQTDTISKKFYNGFPAKGEPCICFQVAINVKTQNKSK